MIRMNVPEEEVEEKNISGLEKTDKNNIIGWLTVMPVIGVQLSGLTLMPMIQSISTLLIINSAKGIAEDKEEVESKGLQ